METMMKLSKDAWADLARTVAGPVLLLFQSDWCPNCRKIAPLLQELADRTAGSIFFGTVDIVKERELASAYAVLATPTLLLLKEGAEVDRLTGSIPKDRLLGMLQKHQVLP